MTTTSDCWIGPATLSSFVPRRSVSQVRLLVAISILFASSTSVSHAAPPRQAAAKPAPKHTSAAPVGDAALATEIEKLLVPRKGAPADSDTVRLWVREAYAKLDYRPAWSTEGTLRATA